MAKAPNRSAGKDRPRPKVTAADLRRDRGICLKWLNDPHRQSHTYDDLDVYRDIITAVSETLRLMAETDKATPKPPPP